jgi:chemotaxis methyl-accepting protein methylase
MMWEALEKRPEMSRTEHEIWRALIEKRCGIDFGETRLSYLCRRCWERMRKCGINSYHEYYNYVAFNSHGAEEWKALLELLVIRETSFFRHTTSYEVLAEQILPRLISEKYRQRDNTIQFWSAGCCTGEETYSLAMVLMEFAQSPLLRLKGCGSDISEVVMEKARRGRYKANALRSMPARYNKYFTLEKEQGEEYYQVSDKVKNIVEFRYLNLREVDHHWLSGQDIIFCHNILMYFTPESRVEVIEELSRRLKPTGFLFLAPGDMVGLKLSGIKPVRIDDTLIYQRAS